MVTALVLPRTRGNCVPDANRTVAKSVCGSRLRTDWAFSSQLTPKYEDPSRTTLRFARFLVVAAGNLNLPFQARPFQKVSQVKKTKRGLYV
jgi:hypothetical protein